MPRNTHSKAVYCGLVLGFAVLSGAAFAHAPIMACYDNGDETVTCEAGYSDGASSHGQGIRILAPSGDPVIEAVFDAAGSYTFSRPKLPSFAIEFIGDSSHKLVVFDDEIY